MVCMNPWDPRDTELLKQRCGSSGIVRCEDPFSFFRMLLLNHVGRGVQLPLLAYTATNVAVISGWNGLYVSMRPQWYTTHLGRIGDGGHARCSMGLKPSLERVVFWPEIPMSEGG